MFDDTSEIRKNMGPEVSSAILKLMRKEGIRVIDNAKITHLAGDYKLEKIHFRKVDPFLSEAEQYLSQEGQPEYFVSTDCVIAENGLGPPKGNLKALIGEQEKSNLSSLTFNNENIPISNVRFSLLQNDIASAYLAAGSCTHYPSFMHKIKVRTDDIKYNIESGFYAAMNMLDKEVEFRYLPVTPLTIGDKKLYFVGERV